MEREKVDVVMLFILVLRKGKWAGPAGDQAHGKQWLRPLGACPAQTCAPGVAGGGVGIKDKFKTDCFWVKVAPAKKRELCNGFKTLLWILVS